MSLTPSQGQYLSLEVVFKKHIVINSMVLVSDLIGVLSTPVIFRWAVLEVSISCFLSF